MPIVTIQVTREGTVSAVDHVTSEQKAALIQGATKLLVEVLGKPSESTFVIIEEIPLENWGRGGLPVAAFRLEPPIPCEKILSSRQLVTSTRGRSDGDCNAFDRRCP